MHYPQVSVTKAMVVTWTCPGVGVGLDQLDCVFHTSLKSDLTVSSNSQRTARRVIEVERMLLLFMIVVAFDKLNKQSVQSIDSK